MVALGLCIWRFMKRPSEIDRHAPAVASLKELCLARLQYSRNDARKAGQRLASQHPSGLEVARYMEVLFDSLSMIETTNNPDTLKSRRAVALEMLTSAGTRAPELMDAGHAETLRGVIIEAASARLKTLAMIRLEQLLTRSATAKTEKTQIKYREAAQAYAIEMGTQPELSGADRAELLTRASVHASAAVPAPMR